MLCAIREANFIQPPARHIERSARCAPPNQQRHRHVFQGSEVSQQLMSLPDKTHGAAAEVFQIAFRKPCQRISAEVYCTAFGMSIAAKRCSKVLLPEPEGPTRATI